MSGVHIGQLVYCSFSQSEKGIGRVLEKITRRFPWTGQSIARVIVEWQNKTEEEVSEDFLVPVRLSPDVKALVIRSVA